MKNKKVFTGWMGVCGRKEYKGAKCQCAWCRKVDGVCVDNDSGGGCAACEGPVTDCNLSVEE